VTDSLSLRLARPVGVPLSRAGESSPLRVAATPTPADPSPADEAHVVKLVKRASVERDQAAFGELYDHFLDRVYRYLFYRTGNQADAEDLTEQVFLQAWAAIHRFQWHGKPFQAWLYSIARNVLVDHRRRVRPTMSIDRDDSPPQIECESASREFEQRLDAQVLGHAISRLTEEQQQVIVLKFVEGLDTSQVAQLLDKQEGTIRALQMRALRNLRRLLESQESEGDRG
jgi:RNA polymerase sigma-70 factor (ECF subfamily)